MCFKPRAADISGMLRLVQPMPWALSILLMVGLAGCTSGAKPATEVTDADVVGSWRAGDAPAGFELVVLADGTYHAEQWPLNLACGVPQAKSAADVSWDDTVSLEGRWVLHEGSGASMTIFFPSEVCSGYSPSASLFIEGDGRLTLNFYLEVPDFVDSTTTVVFYRDSR